jgi:Relaxase/Mobilisation nuclease domain
MEHTASRAEELKAAAGRSKGGRKRQKNVYCYSLSWHPTEKPTKEEMLEAAFETMKALGIDDREALIVAHSDEPHPHNDGAARGCSRRRVSQGLRGHMEQDRDFKVCAAGQFVQGDYSHFLLRFHGCFS